MALTFGQPRPWRLRVAAVAGLVFLAGFGWFVVDLLGSIPSKQELRAFSDMASANILYDAADREVFTIAKEHRIEVPLAEISPNLIKAVIAIEDRRFFDHEGFRPHPHRRLGDRRRSSRRSGPGRQHHHATTGAAERRPRENAAPQVARIAVRLAARTSLHQGRDPRSLFEQSLFRQRPVRRRSRVARILRQEGVGVIARRSVAARGPAESAVELRPVAGASKGRSAPGRRPEGDARQQGDHARGIRHGVQDADRDLRRPPRRRSVRPVLQGRSPAPARRANSATSASTRAD